MLIDYHIHNHFSPDSESDTRKIVKKALERGIREICITNHPELHDPKTGKDIFDLKKAKKIFRQIKEEIREIQKEYPQIKIGFGMEMGYHKGWMQNLKKLIEEADLDFVLGSVHVVSDVIISSHLFADDLYSKTDEETAYGIYFKNMKELVQWGHIDVIAHFDICKKFGHKFYGPFQPEKYKNQILPILKLMKTKGIGLELNTKCMKNRCKEIFPHPTILRWAAEIGLEHFTIGSDAHKASEVGRCFNEALRIAKKAKIRTLSTYQKRKPAKHTI
ncbi:histidinol-phosphatase [Candidatus Peregrinibacteria bacterium]|nr:histidinol-phosphatase [Candidatus Peregrinibacteria bacterium]